MTNSEERTQQSFPKFAIKMVKKEPNLILVKYDVAVDNVLIQKA
jgi:hypothetical protein